MPAQLTKDRTALHDLFIREADDALMLASTDRCHDLRRTVKAGIGIALMIAVLARCIELVSALRTLNEGPLLTFPLSVIFPALVVTAMAFAPPAVSQEGALMRLGTMVQCVLIIVLPRLAIHLALGLPVVFLLVELFETRCSTKLRNAIVRRIVT